MAAVALVVWQHGEHPVGEWLLLASPFCGCITRQAPTHAGKSFAVLHFIAVWHHAVGCASCRLLLSAIGQLS